MGLQDSKASLNLTKIIVDAVALTFMSIHSARSHLPNSTLQVPHPLTSGSESKPPLKASL